MNNTDFMKLAFVEMDECNSFPKVGCVIVKNKKVLSSGFRNEVQGKHAERVALEKISNEDSQGSTLYTTLEPCTQITDSQKTPPCSEFIISRGVASCVVGVFDPNGKIYTNGWKVLRDASITVGFFNESFQAKIKSKTFKYSDFNTGYGSGSRRVRVERGQKSFTVYFSSSDDRCVKFRWSRLNRPKDRFDIISSNETVFFAKNASSFAEIINPISYQDSSHCFRLGLDEIVVIRSVDKKMNLLVQLTAFSETDVEFKWEVRNT